ncbi:MAG: OmpA family protein [Pseudomonadota bacterium]
MHRLVPGIVLALTVTALPAPEVAAQSTDQSVLERQRQLLIERRRQQQKTRTLLEINPSTGRVEEQAPVSSGTGTVVSTDPTPSGNVASSTAGSSRQDVASAPIDLNPEDQLFRPIKFAYDSAFLDNSARGILDGLCDTLKADLELNPGSRYFVIGHTDAAGGDDYNLRLSQRRADATKQYLVDGCGIATAQLQSVGMGEQRLLASAGPRSAVQRRVEIQVDIGG